LVHNGAEELILFNAFVENTVVLLNIEFRKEAQKVARAVVRSRRSTETRTKLSKMKLKPYLVAELHRR